MSAFAKHRPYAKLCDSRYRSESGRDVQTTWTVKKGRSGAVDGNTQPRFNMFNSIRVDMIELLELGIAYFVHM
jgi:hypothetical protein